MACNVVKFTVTEKDSQIITMRPLMVSKGKGHNNKDIHHQDRGMLTTGLTVPLPCQVPGYSLNCKQTEDTQRID